MIRFFKDKETYSDERILHLLEELGQEEHWLNRFKFFPGWLPLIQYTLFQFKQELNQAEYRHKNRSESFDSPPSIKFVQFKEKFGSMRLYIQVSGDQAFKQACLSIETFAENMSMLFCDTCGTNQHVCTRKPNGYWIRNLCRWCFIKSKISIFVSEYSPKAIYRKYKWHKKWKVK